VAARGLCLTLGHRWQDSLDDYDAEYSEYPILHCARCGKQKAFPPWKALDPVWRLGWIGRLRFVATQAAPWVVLAVLIGLAIAGIVGLVALAAGEHGAHAVRSMVIALVVVGVLAILATTLVDPMGYEGGTSLTFGRGMRFPSSGWKAESLRSGPSPNIDSGKGFGALMRVDDVVYAGGAILIGIGVLLYNVAI
jgi:hypothetical protein